MDFVFDRTADGRVLKCLTVVDDATHESVTIVSERDISGLMLTRILGRLALTRGLPQAIRTDNGKEFCSRAMLACAHERGVRLFLIQPGKPNQNAYIESFRALPGRVPERALVHDPTACQGPDREVAAGTKRGKTQGRIGRADARRLCAVTGPKSR